MFETRFIDDVVQKESSGVRYRGKDSKAQSNDDKKTLRRAMSKICLGSLWIFEGRRLSGYVERNRVGVRIRQYACLITHHRMAVCGCGCEEK